MSFKLFTKIFSGSPKYCLQLFALVVTQPIILASVLVTLPLLYSRYLGFLEQLELHAFDRFIQLQGRQKPDPRLLIVKVTDAELRQYGVSLPNGRTSLPDQILYKLLQKLEQEYQPRGIGIDIFRPEPTGKGYSDLVKQLQQNQRTIIVCGLPWEGHPSIPAPPDISEQQIGFADLESTDPDSVIRRYILFLKPVSSHLTSVSKNYCDDDSARRYSFALRLASLYLKAENIQPKFVSEENRLKLGTRVLQPIDTNAGGYRNVEILGEQILLNYRAQARISQSVTLTQMLEGQVDPDQVNGRLVLIGYALKDVKEEDGDAYLTPYSKGQEKKIPGVVIHAHMVSQLLDLAAHPDRHALIWSLSEPEEGFWIWGWSLLGGSAAWITRRSRLSFFAGSAVLALLGFSCYGFFLIGGWIPLVPAAIAVIATGGTVIAISEPHLLLIASFLSQRPSQNRDET